MIAPPTRSWPLDLREYSPVDERALSQEQLQEHLRRQMKHLRNSSRLFDEGDLDEAVRLAATVRVLIHQTRSSHSLLGQLKLRETLWVDSCRYREDVQLAQLFALQPGTVVAASSPTETGLVRVGADPTTLAPRWAAPLGSVPAKLSPLDLWWKRPGIETSNGRTFNRSELVLAMSNKDGGSHVDPSVPADYDDFSRDFLGVQWADGDFLKADPPGGWQQPTGNVAAASMRQVAWEVQESLYRLQLPWLPRS